MDLEAFVTTHAPEWDRMDELARRSRTLTGAEADELVSLYRRASTHLSMLRASAPDPALLGRLSRQIARARVAITGTRSSGAREFVRFVTVTFPAAVYLNRRWWVVTALVWILVAAVIAWWVAVNPSVQATIAAPEDIRRLVEEDFENYYSANPAASFAAQVWTNNAWVAAGALVLGVFVGIPVLYILVQNVVNIAVSAGLMAAAGRLDVFFGLITPHGLLELTAVFVAAGAGLRLGWTVVDPGPRTRADAVAIAGRSAVGIALGLVGVLLVSGVIEAFVTPSGLPTWARIAVGVLAEAAFLTYVWVLGGRAVRLGEVGDVDDPVDARPVTA